MQFPKISIITPSFNQGKYIEQTILSIINQGYPNLEYIIVDGGSTDGTIEIIKKYASHLSYWVSETDKGQADAINKGLHHCSGKIFNWINSDDYLAEGSLFKIADGFCNEKTGLIAGAVWNFGEGGQSQLIINKKLEIEEFFKFDCEYIYHQPGVWMRLDIMKQVGTFRTDYHYCFDQQYLLRYLLINDEVKYIPDTIAFFRFHSESKSIAHASGFFLDFNRIYREFWKEHKGTPISIMAKEKHKKYEWPLLQESAGKERENRFTVFLVAFWLIIKDPFYRLNKANIGWLKHIIFGKRI